MEANLPIPFLKCNRYQNPESFPRCLERTFRDRGLSHNQISPLPCQALLFAEIRKEAPVLSRWPGWCGGSTELDTCPSLGHSRVAPTSSQKNAGVWLMGSEKSSYLKGAQNVAWPRVRLRKRVFNSLSFLPLDRRLLEEDLHNAVLLKL